MEEDTDSVDNHLELPACATTAPAEIATLAKIPELAATCGAVPPPPAPEARPWVHYIESPALSILGAHHRGRDSFYAVGEPQWVLGKFTYSLIDKTLIGEEVDIFVLRGCEGQWEKLGTATTTKSGEHATVEGIEDGGGRVYFRIPEAKRLPVGRHRIRMVVAGDGTAAEQYIEVLPKGTPIFVSDVDGTLTERKVLDSPLFCDEDSELPAMWRVFFDGNGQPSVHEGAPMVYQSLSRAGYRPFYLTARPEWLAPHTRKFLSQAERKDGRGEMPEGIVHTTLGEFGTFGSGAEAFKDDELKRLTAKGFKVTFAFGNRKSDVAIYNRYNVPYRFYFENQPTAHRICSQVVDLPELTYGAAIAKGDSRFKSFVGLIGTIGAVPNTCR